MYYVLYYTISGYYNCELCNCATRSHFALYVCMYLCQSRLGPGTYQVTSYASAARVSRGYMVCAHVAWLAHSRVAWLHGLRDGQRLPEGAGETSSAKTQGEIGPSSTPSAGQDPPNAN